MPTPIKLQFLGYSLSMTKKPMKKPKTKRPSKRKGY